MGNEWRLIESGPGNAAYNMALDEAIALSVRKGDSPPTLRIYAWLMPSVSLGCFQRSSDINFIYCRTAAIPVVRRITGGRAILHGDELTYSFSAGTDKGPFSGGLLESYDKISSALSLALHLTGLRVQMKKVRESGRVLTRSPICFQSESYGELSIGQKKIIGSAQKRWVDGLLQQGSIPFNIDYQKLQGIFGKSDMKIMESMAGLKELEPELDERQFKENILRAFGQTFGISLVPSELTARETLIVRSLEEEKYLLESWTLKR